MSAARGKPAGDPLAKLQADLGKGRRPFYLLTGEPWLRSQALQMIRDALVPVEQRAFSYEERQLDNHSDWAEVEALLRSYGFFDGAKLVHLEVPGKLGEDTRKALASFLEEPAGQNTLCLSAPNLEQLMAAKNRMEKGGGLALKFEAMNERELGAWVAARLAAAGVEHTTDFPAQLVAALPPDPGEILGEIEKLRLAARPGKRLDARDLSRLVGHQRREDVWRLAGLLQRGREAEALNCLRDILDGGGSDAIALIGALTYTFTMLLRARLLLDEGKNRQQAASALPLWGGRARDYVERAARLKKRELLAWLFNLQKLDARLKRGPAGRERQLVESTLLASLQGQAIRL